MTELQQAMSLIKADKEWGLCSVCGKPMTVRPANDGAVISVCCPDHLVHDDDVSIDSENTEGYYKYTVRPRSAIHILVA